MWIKIEERDLECLRKIVAAEESNRALVTAWMRGMGMEPAKDDGETARRLLAAIEKPRDLEALVTGPRDEAGVQLDYFSTRAGADREGAAFHRGRVEALQEVLEMLRREGP